MTTTTLPSGSFYPTSFTQSLATAYKAGLDAATLSMARLGGQFLVNEFSTPIMNVVILPGHLLRGTTLTEIGCWLMADLTDGASTITVPVNSEAAIINGMTAFTPYLPTAVASGTTVTISGATVTLSTVIDNVAGTPNLIFIAQKSPAIVAPVTNPRIDRVVLSQTTGIVSIITGAESATPSPPAITAGNYPLAQVLLQTSTTAITNDMITDERDFTPPTSIFGYVAVTSTYSILGNDCLVEATSGTFTATLPTAVGRAGKQYILKNSGAGTLTWATTSAQTVDTSEAGLLQTTGTLAQYHSMTVYSNGANWLATA